MTKNKARCRSTDRRNDGSGPSALPTTSQSHSDASNSPADVTRELEKDVKSGTDAPKALYSLRARVAKSWKTFRALEPSQLLLVSQIALFIRIGMLLLTEAVLLKWAENLYTPYRLLLVGGMVVVFLHIIFIVMSRPDNAARGHKLVDVLVALFSGWVAVQLVDKYSDYQGFAAIVGGLLAIAAVFAIGQYVAHVSRHRAVQTQADILRRVRDSKGLCEIYEGELKKAKFRLQECKPNQTVDTAPITSMYQAIEQLEQQIRGKVITLDCHERKFHEPFKSTNMPPHLDNFEDIEQSVIQLKDDLIKILDQVSGIAIPIEYQRRVESQAKERE